MDKKIIKLPYSTTHRAIDNLEKKTFEDGFKRASRIAWAQFLGLMTLITIMTLLIVYGSFVWLPDTIKAYYP